VATSTYCDHRPLCRQERIFERYGVETSGSTHCDWIAATSDRLEPIYDRMKADVLESKLVRTDDTPVPVTKESTVAGV